MTNHCREDYAVTKRVSPSIELEARIEELLGAQEAFDSETLAELGRLGAQLVMPAA